MIPMIRETITKIIIPIANKELALSIVKALEVDNRLVPKGMSIVMNLTPNGDISILIKIKNHVDILTLRNTIDDLLEHLSLLLKTSKHLRIS